MEDLPSASTIAKRVSSGIAGVSISQRTIMEGAIKTLEERLNYRSNVNAWAAIKCEWDVTTAMRSHLNRLGYETKQFIVYKSSSGYTTHTEFLMRIRPDVESIAT